MHCPSCGKEVPGGASFCPNCGGKIPREETVEGTTQAPQSGGAGETLPVAHEDSSKAGEGDRGARDGRSATVAQPTPGAQPARAKRGRRDALMTVLGVALVAALVFGVTSLLGGFGGQGAAGDDQQAPITEPDPDQQDGRADEEDSSSQDDGGDEPGSGRFEELTVSDVEVDADAPEGPKVTLTVTNNQDQIVVGSHISVSGTYTVTNNYGDEVENEGNLDLICTERGTREIPYLFPGENELELIPTTQDNIVASYTNSYTRETQSYRLQDLNGIEVSVGSGRLIDPDQYAVLDEGDYTIDLQMALDGNSPVLNVALTNDTDYRWRSATVYLVAVGADGRRATRIGSDSNSAAFSVGPVSESYFNVGEAKQMQAGYSSDLDVDHFEIQRVIVEKELVETGEDE